MTTYGNSEDFTGVTSYFNYSAPGYFRIYASGSDATITSGLLSYSCKPGITLKEFGNYPKTMLDETDGAFLIESLNTASGTLPTSDNKQLWKDYGCYPNGATSSYMWYIDMSSGTNKYHGVYFTTYRPGATVKDSLSYNQTCQSTNGFSTGHRYWFKYEPLTWRVLATKTENSETKLLLLSQYYVNSTHYYHSHDDHDGAHSYEYSTSDLRTWLNGSFYDAAFTNAEKIKSAPPAGRGAITSPSSPRRKPPMLLMGLTPMRLPPILNAHFWGRITPKAKGFMLPRTMALASPLPPIPACETWITRLTE